VILFLFFFLEFSYDLQGALLSPDSFDLSFFITQLHPAVITAVSFDYALRDITAAEA